ncbi:MAG: hypothetical protein HGA96_00930 [Desulfobulbaceae bacterium]|nr:hypothetical protein [Desulfobulbaceae bacterium]
MLKRLALVVPLLLSLVACGPIIGQLMRAADGVKNFRVVSGDLASLRKGLHILVVGPFDMAPGAWEISRGDDAAFFLMELNRASFFSAELHMGDRYAKAAKSVAEAKAKSAAQLKADYALEAEPDVLMFATVLSRETIVAPTRGIIMEVGYRLEFYNPTTTKSTVVEIAVREHFKDCLKLVVDELARQVVAASL